MSAETPQPPSSHERPHPSSTEQAARASWLAPLVAIVLLLLTWKMPAGTGSIVIAIICGVLVLAGLCLGIAALARFRLEAKYHAQAGQSPTPRSAMIQAGTGVGLSLLVIIGMTTRTFFTGPPAASVSSAGPATGPSSTAGVAPDIILDYPGWMGGGAEARVNYGLVSLPDDAPGTKEFKKSFGKDFTVLLLTIDTSRAPFDVYTDTSRAVAHFSDGRTVDALPIQSVLESATQDRDKLIAQWMPPQREQAGASQIYNLFIPMPPGTMFQVMDRVTIQVNGLPVDLRGQYLSVAEKAQRFRNQQQPPATSGRNPG